MRIHITVSHHHVLDVGEIELEKIKCGQKSDICFIIFALSYLFFASPE